MKTLCSLNHISKLSGIAESSFEEVLLCSSELSRLGHLQMGEVLEAAKVLREKGKRVVLLWDILMVEDVFMQKAGLVHTMELSLFDAIRVQDPGALEYALSKTSLPIQLILETGNRNFEAIKSWVALCEGRCERIVLSIELPENKLQELVPQLNQLGVQSELLIFGHILLFYSPRSLVKDLFGTQDSWIEVKGNSEESPHKGFPIIENPHGTFMFNTKDLNLMNEREALDKMGLDWGRVEVDEMDESFYQNPFEVDVTSYPRSFIKGFYRSNKTDVLFKKLKNQRLQERGADFIGEVVEVEKNAHVALLIKNAKRTLKIGDAIKLLTPEGKEKEIEVLSMENSTHKELVEAGLGAVVLLNPVGGISVKTLAFWQL